VYSPAQRKHEDVYYLVQHTAHLTLFDEAPDVHFEFCRAAYVEAYGVDDVVFSAGEKADCYYIIAAGVARVRIADMSGKSSQPTPAPAPPPPLDIPVEFEKPLEVTPAETSPQFKTLLSPSFVISHHSSTDSVKSGTSFLGSPTGSLLESSTISQPVSKLTMPSSSSAVKSSMLSMVSEIEGDEDDIGDERHDTVSAELAAIPKVPRKRRVPSRSQQLLSPATPEMALSGLATRVSDESSADHNSTGTNTESSKNASDVANSVEIGVGMGFGELGLLSKSLTRSATVSAKVNLVRCLSDVFSRVLIVFSVCSSEVLAQVLLRLDTPDYDRILRQHHIQIYQRRKEFLMAQSLLSKLPEYRLLQFVYQCVQVTYKSGDVIIEHGAPAATVCWLMKGRVVVSRPYHIEYADDYNPFSHSGGAPLPAGNSQPSTINHTTARKVFEEVAQIDAEMHARHALFGEIGCILDRPRTARVTAIMDSQVLVCPWELLQKVMNATGDPDRKFGMSRISGFLSSDQNCSLCNAHVSASLIRDAYEVALYSQSSADRTEADIDKLLDECGDAIDSACPHLSVRSNSFLISLRQE
jgi:CRP-like cAMP-binding protein